MHVISVTPTEGGWMVDADILAAPLIFHSGGRAETAAKSLGEGLARAGRWAEVQVYAMGSKLLGRFICPPRLCRQDPFDGRAPAGHAEQSILLARGWEKAPEGRQALEGVA